jgi:filamentous hemagglutinin
LFLASSSTLNAGDILRGGASANVPNPQGNSAATNATAAQARTNAKDALSRTANALQALKNLQAAAQAAARSGPNNAGADPNHPGLQLPNVPNGLAPGGLHFQSGIGALAPTQTAAGGLTNVTIKQTSQQALLNWTTFNVGRDTNLHFDQSAGGEAVGQWIAFNRVTDPSGSPSQILGSITAPGQVYIINQNGIIFGSGSQVNVHTLVASSLPINDNLINRGLLNNPDSQFLFSALAIPAGAKGTPAFTPPAPLTPNGRIGDVTVQAGAVLSSPTSADRVGGRIALIGPNVHNAGTILTPDGQTILAAGLQVGFTAHKSSDPSLRGLDTYIGAVVDPASALAPYAGTVTNTGYIEALRGNITMAGKRVEQLGGLRASTSVSLNGSIILSANYDAVGNPAGNETGASSLPFLNKSSGHVELGAGSAIEILPEWSSVEKVPGTKLALPSKIEISGKTIHMGRDATILAPNANVSLSAGVWNFISGATPDSSLMLAGGQVYLEPGALINVAGTTDAVAPISENIIVVQLRGSELADSPLQRLGLLRGVNLVVDLRKTGVYNGFTWVGTPLGDLTGYLNLVQRTVSELTTAGGSVKINAGSSTVIQNGAKIDVSAGWTNFEGGYVQTSRVMAYGRLFEISDATPDLVYQGVYDGLFHDVHPRWSITNTYTVPWMLNGHYDPGYIWGADGGSLAINSPAMALDGDFFGNTLNGPRQRSVLAKASTLELNFIAQRKGNTGLPVDYSPTPPAISFGDGSQGAAGPFVVDAAGDPAPLRADRVARVLLSPSLFNERGFGNLTVNNPDGSITVPSGIDLTGPPGGSLTLAGANITISGNVTVPAGNLKLTAYNISPGAVPFLTSEPTANIGRGNVTVAPGANLSTAGLLVDDRLSSPNPLTLPLLTNGGTIAINTFSANLQRGATIDVSGGIAIGATGRQSYGNGGALIINTGRDVSRPGVTGGTLELGATLRGFAGVGAKGASLTLQALLLQIGGRSAYPGTTILQPEFFSEGGFTTFNISGIGAATDDPDKFIPGLIIAPNTTINPQVASLLAVPYPHNHLTFATTTALYPEGMRPALSLNFSAVTVSDDYTGALKIRGDLVFGQGAVVRTNPLGNVSLKADTIAMLGSIIAPGGTISLTGANQFPSNATPTQALPTVYLGPRSLLSTEGVVVLQPDAYGRRVGTVLPGGTVTVAGNIVGARGSVIDVSGASGILDLHPNYLGSETSPLVLTSSGLTTPLYRFLNVATQVDSNGGTVILRGGQELFVDSTIKGFAGGPTATGGSLIVTSGRYYDPLATRTPLDTSLLVKQSGWTLPAGFAGIGNPVVDGSGTPIPGMGYFSANTFLRGGFDSLTLGGSGAVEFSGPITIDARASLYIANSGFIKANDTVNLSAPYVALGQAFLLPTNPLDVLPTVADAKPTYGSGILNVRADHIDIGNLSLQGIGQANLIANGGDIRGSGSLNIAGNLLMRAAQIYPAAATSFTINVADYLDGGLLKSGTVNFESSGIRNLPLEAGGTLNVFASIINQGGTLRAPLGIINLGWDGTGTAPLDSFSGLAVTATRQVNLLPGSITSVSGIDPITGQGVIFPYGIIQNGTSWIDPAGNDITVSGPPAKAINISGMAVNTQAGSVIDISGGGDLYAYRWIQGIGGTKDILASTTSFAVIPGYNANFAPFGAFNNGSNAGNLGGDPGYVNGSLRPGDQIYLGASESLRAGVYTLLPARYALLPGAVLVTPQSGIPIGTFEKVDGASLVSGYRYNSLNGQREVPEIFSRFEVAPASVVRQRAEYQDYFANAWFTESALKRDAKTPRLPMDAGQLVLAATTAMAVNGSVITATPLGGRGALVDISSPVDIVITGASSAPAPGSLVLNAGQLNGFGAASLLIGGIRKFGPDGTSVTVKTNRLTVDNAGTPLTGTDIILVSNQNLTLAPGASITQTGSQAGSADTILLGSATAGSGDGLLVRVSSDPNAQVIRSGVSASNVPQMTIGAGVLLSGASVTLDSTYGTSLSPTASLLGQTVNLNSGQISLALNNPGVLQPTAGLVLAGAALANLQSATSLNFLSYSSLDIYGTGQVGSAGLANLGIHAAQIRGFNTGGGTATLTGQNVFLDNSPGRSALGIVAAPSGTFVIDAGTLHLGKGGLAIDQYADVKLNASGGIINEGSGTMNVAGNLTLTTPVLTGAAGSSQSLTAGGALVIQKPAGGGTSTVTGGLGALLNLTGTSVSQSSEILLPSGVLNIRATTGNLDVAGNLNLAGTVQTIHDLSKPTDGGQVKLTADAGSVTIASGSLVNVAAPAIGGNAGSVVVSSPLGNFVLNGAMAGQGGLGGRNGEFTLDAATIPDLLGLNQTLNTTGFTAARNLRVRTGNVTLDGISNAQIFRLSVDVGSLTVNGSINASGLEGGTIALDANGALVLSSSAILNAAGQRFSAAGKGGEISLATRGDAGGQLQLSAGSTIELSVAENSATSAANGLFTGTLHLRAPQNAASDDLALSSIDSTILGASSVVAEGYRLFELNNAAGSTITSAVQTNVRNNGIAFVGDAGVASAGYDAMLNRLTSTNLVLRDSLVIQPGAEIVNRTGDLILGTTASTNTSDWNLANNRFGPKSAPGDLTLRAAGNLTFYNAISDGFFSSAYNSLLLSQNTLLGANQQSYSYNLTAGADFTASDVHQVRPLTTLGATSGLLQLGKNAGLNLASTPGNNATTASAVNNRFQVIRTGSGSINVAAARDVHLLNQFATIYTAGTKAVDATMGGQFDIPVISLSGTQGELGAIQQSPGYAPQYALAGGNVSIFAQGDIKHLTRNTAGTLIDDSSRELPYNWLYRRGALDANGNFALSRNNEIASTSWWVDYSNFFEGVGALGGGNVSLVAGGNIKNVDAVAPTNARMTKTTPSTATLIELGGGNVTINAGGNIDGGAYYVERGQGRLLAGGEITTNSTRTPSLGAIINQAPQDGRTWLPTTLFLGKGGFDVSARKDLLLGPTVNPFWLPQGYSNTYWYKTYFNTYDSNSSVSLSSLTGNVTLRTEVSTANSTAPVHVLQAWFAGINRLTDSSASRYQPWLKLAEAGVSPFSATASLLPGTVKATSFSGNLNLQGSLTLSPSPTGTLELVAANAINGLQPTGFNIDTNANIWTTSTINLSDSNPDALPGTRSPYAFQSLLGSTLAIATRARATPDSLLNFIGVHFAESGSIVQNLSDKQNLHAPGPLHSGDTTPVYLYAGTGDISGLELFSGKAARITAGQDIRDISFYIQNLGDNDVSLVSAGRDITPYDATAPLRITAQSSGNALATQEIPLLGDLQISGPGTLEILAGRHIDLGTGASLSDGTGTGITSIGNARNPNLPFAGSSVIVGAGIGGAAGLESATLDFEGFIAQYVTTANLAKYQTELSASFPNLTGGNFSSLPKEEQHRIALEVFYKLLRDSGREHNLTVGPNAGTYASGLAAIASLFPNAGTAGDITTQSRDIRTKSGGDISIFAPGGKLTLATSVIGTPLAPPGIITEGGGNISIFTNGNVDLGISRIFTLRGGNEIIWSSAGDIAAGSASKTVASAPPTRVIIDPQSGDVKVDLAGLATGGGIGVLATVAGLAPGSVDLIAVAGKIDAGDAGIRSAGTLNLAAPVIANASNIAAGGATSGAPAVSAPSAPSVAAPPPPPPQQGNKPEQAMVDPKPKPPEEELLPSLVTVEIMSYGGGGASTDEDKDEEERKKREREAQERDAAATPQ